MASISTDSRGNRRILFTNNGVRKTLYLGKTNKRTAGAIGARVEELLSCQASGLAWPVDLARWVAEIGDDLADKVAATGLLPPRQSSTLGVFLEGFLERRSGAKPNSLKNYKQAVKKLLEGFGSDVNMSAVTHAGAVAWHAALSKRYSKAYAGRLVKFARQFFNEAKSIVPTNPFTGIKCGSQTNESRKLFITYDTFLQLVDACPDTEWRLIVALARLGGLRCPSEVMALRWSDMDWDRGRMTVKSPKTEHHEGGASRVVPIFPELRPYLDDAYELAERGAVKVITRYADPGANLRTQLLRIIDRAGLEPWTRPFQNLRASCETELARKFPIHVVCAWIGNSPKVAAKHYLTVTDADFSLAAGDASDDAGSALSASDTRRQERQTESEVQPDYALTNSSLGPGVTGRTATITPDRSRDSGKSPVFFGHLRTGDAPNDARPTEVPSHPEVGLDRN